jgi:hypothetical protein
MLPHGQELLVRAATADSADGAAAWAAWRAGRSLEEVPAALLSRVGCRLAERGAAGSKSRGAFRKAWYENQLKFRSLGQALAACHDAEVDAVLGFEASFVLGGDPTAAARPVYRGGLVVTPEEAPTAATALAQSGWRSVREVRGRSFLAHCPAERFWNSEGHGLELRWRFPWEVSDAFARSRAAVPFLGVEAPALGATELLLHLLTCEFRTNAAEPAAWVADALDVIGRGGIDWPRVRAAGHVPGLALPMFVRLDYLRRAWAAAVPNDVIEHLGHCRITTLDRWQQSLAARPTVGRLGRVAERCLWHWRCHRQRQGCLRAIATLPTYAVHNVTLPGAHVVRRLFR